MYFKSQKKKNLFNDSKSKEHNATLANYQPQGLLKKSQQQRTRLTRISIEQW
jgi:hypothetical protein